MSDDERIERLTELARRVPEWRSLGVHVSGDERYVLLVTRTPDNVYNHPVKIVHPRALDALEAALLVLSGEAEMIEPWRREMLRDRIEHLERRLKLAPAEPQPDAPTDIAALPDYWDERRRRQGKPDLSRCAAELRIALKPKP